MTLCIGALAHDHPVINPCVVLCFDYKVSNEVIGSESEYKLRVLSHQLIALFAGSPGRAHELALLFKDYLSRTNLTLVGAASQLREPLTTFKRRMADSYVQRRLAVSYQDFLDHGKEWFGPEAYERRLTAIERHDLRVELIIAGFVEGEAVLFQVRQDADGGVELEQCTNFCVIGTGAYTAEPALHARAHTFTTPLADALYNVYEAKRVGESSPYVGARTRILVLKHGLNRGEFETHIRVVEPAGEKWLRGLYRRHGPRPIRQRLEIPDTALMAGRPLERSTNSSKAHT